MSTDAKGPNPTCRECRGVLRWDAVAQRLRCKDCGASSAASDEGRIVEHDLEEALDQGLPRGRIGTGSRQVRCRECLAEAEVPDELAATRCEFCGSTLVLVQEAAADHFLPESMIPFAIDRAAAVRAFRSWLGSLWLRPTNIGRAASLHELHGVYVPYWTFSCKVTSRYSAEAGYTTYYEEESRSGIPERRIARRRWEPCTGQRHDRYSNLLVCASRGLASELRAIANYFDLAGLLPYSPEYLWGFAAERYAVDLPAAWQRARTEIERLQDDRCAADIPGDTKRGLRTTHQIEGVRFKHVLLPLWIATYRYRGRLHRFLVNGQSGRVAGTAPYSEWKVVLTVLLILATAGALLYFLHAREPRPQRPSLSARSKAVVCAPCDSDNIQGLRPA
ncbi:MAG: hypothetical protein U1A78_36035 [Polyangia bacterium]